MPGGPLSRYVLTCVSENSLNDLIVFYEVNVGGLFRNRFTV